MYNQVEYYEGYSPCFNSFDKREETTNVRAIKALLSVQNDAVSEILNERQKYIVMRVICEDAPQKAVAKELGITPSALCREFHLALNKLILHEFGGNRMIEIIIAAIVGVFVGGMIGTTIMPLYATRKGEKDTIYQCAVVVHKDNTAELVVRRESAYPFANCNEAHIDKYPLIEVQTPHGRLIDADNIDEITVCNNKKGFLSKIDAPTIIEAGGE